MKLKLILFFSLFAAVRTHFLPRLLGGENADPNDFPNIAILKGYETDWHLLVHFCGGNIANEWWILITAKCASGIGPIYPKEHVIVEVGKWRLNGWEPFSQSRNISNAYTHDKFDPSKGVQPFDLALVKVIVALELHSRVKVIPISPNVSYPSGWVIMAGWGPTTTVEVSKSQSSEILQVLNATVLTREECIESIRELTQEGGTNLNTRTIDQYVFCTGGSGNIQGPGSSDAGGPVMQKNKLGEYEVVGLIAAGIRPYGYKAPALHTHLPPLNGWIESTMSLYSRAQA